MKIIDKKIKSISVINQPDRNQPTPYEVTPIPEILNAKRYKITPPETISKNSLYIIVTDDGERVLELFLMSKDVSINSYLITIARLISATFRTQINPTYSIQELIESQSVSGYFHKGTYYNSIMHHIGSIILGRINELKRLSTIGDVDEADQNQPPERCVNCVE